MYSFVNIATVVRDLARHPRAGAVAEALLRAFAVDEAALAVLDELEVDASAQAERRAVAVAEAARLPGHTSSVGLLERVTLGSLADLQAFVRRDVLAHAWAGDADLRVATHPQALNVVGDGVVGTSAGDAELARPWCDAVTDLGLEPAATPWPHAVAAVRALSPDAAVPPAPAEWSARMHGACWAVHLTGRERDAAVTQLHALRALVGITGPRPPLRTVAMVVAATHATVVADVLDAPTHDAMTQPLFRLLP